MDSPSSQGPDLPRSWESEELFFSADSYFNDLLSGVAKATKTVCFVSYIFSDGRLAARVRAALTDAARRGVDVRFMVDGVGSPFWGGADAEVLEAAGVRCAVYWPPPWQLWQWPFTGPLARTFGGFLRWLGHSLAHLNRRDHRKLCVVDGHTAWLGSMNVSDEHLSRMAGGAGWRDTGVRVTGSGVQTLEAHFDLTWTWTLLRSDFDPGMEVPGPRTREDYSQMPVRSNEEWRKRRGFARDLVARIGGARERVWITNAYFVPDLSILRALKRAARLGADVRVLLPGQTDVALVGWASSQFFSSLMEGGVRVFEYGSGVLHAKSLLLDRWAMVGSSNLNQRSWRHDLELDVALIEPVSLASLEARFRVDLEHSIEIQRKTWRGTSHIRRALGWLALLVRNVL